ncbi:MAG: hypothetical protein CMJ01_00050 [Pelagibacteraceae bacterium]|nr:hypothetical protein [Pelagibacteraceae bacterium]|tara:strand:+ start:9896 stop:10396 length:501 start_codon:yes stop_codon:yes gene_type:complete
MENEEKISFLKTLIVFYENNKTTLVVLATIVVLSILSLNYLNYHKKNENIKISEKYVKAGIYLTLNKKKDSRAILKEIIESHNKFYSILSLNTIIDNNLEKNNEEVLKLFEIVENTSKEKEQNNLIKLKKALFLIKISREEEGKIILNEIVSDDSIWKETASEILE